MTEIPEGLIPIWNRKVEECGPDRTCKYWNKGRCVYVWPNLVCPNPECHKRQIVNYEEIENLKKREPRRKRKNTSVYLNVAKDTFDDK